VKTSPRTRMFVAVLIVGISIQCALMAAETPPKEHESERIPRTAAQSKSAELPLVPVNTTLGKAPFAPVRMKEVTRYGGVPYYAVRFKTPKFAGTFIWGFNCEADQDIFYTAIVPAKGLALERPGQTFLTLKSDREGVGRKGESLLFERYNRALINSDTEYIICIGRHKEDPVVNAAILNMFQGRVPELNEDGFPGLGK